MFRCDDDYVSCAMASPSMRSSNEEKECSVCDAIASAAFKNIYNALAILTVDAVVVFFRDLNRKFHSAVFLDQVQRSCFGTVEPVSCRAEGCTEWNQCPGRIGNFVCAICCPV